MIPGGRRTDRSGTPSSADSGADEVSPFRSFRRPGVWTLVASITLVVATGIATALYVRSRGAGPPASDAIFEALSERRLDAPSPGAGPAAPRAPVAHASDPAPFADPSAVPERARPALQVVDDVERGRAAGRWSVARKRFGACPGQDVERTAWIDPDSRIVKITATRDGRPPVAVEQWFDRAGALRAVRAGGGEPPWTLRALLDGGGAVVHSDATGAAPDLDALRVARRDPSAAFFDPPRCDPEKPGKK